MFKSDPVEDILSRFRLFAEGDDADGDQAGGEQGDEAGAKSGDAGKSADPGKSGEDDWRMPITDPDLRKVADRFASLPDMTKAVADLRKRESTAIRIPGKDATEKDVAAFRKALGVPAAATDYVFEPVEGAEPSEADKAFQGAAAETFHSLNITAEQAKGLNAWWNKVTAEALQEQVKADKSFADESEAALKEEWPGQEFARNKAHADRAAATLFGDELDKVRHIETKDGRFVLDHPAFVKVLAQYGREMQEGRLGGVMTDGDLDNINTQIKDLEDKIDKAQAKGDREAANKLYHQQQALYAKRYGSAPIVGAEGRTV